MSKSCNRQNNDYSCESNSGFIFGLICGAIIGAIIAVIIYKNNKTEVFEKLDQKIKFFFKDFISKTETTSTPKSSPQKIIIKSILKKSSPKPETKIIEPIFVKPKKSVPKTFIKPKK